VNNLNIPQASYLVTRILDELISLILSALEISNGGINDLDINYEGEEPISKLKFLEQHFDPFKHLNIQDFMINMGSYLSELLNVFTLNEMSEYGILMNFLTHNVDRIDNMSSVRNRIEGINKINNSKNIDFD